MSGTWLAGTIAMITATLASSPPQARTVQERLGYPATARLLVIHADDLGMSHSVNQATFEAFEQGAITSASILVPCPWFPDVVQWAATHPEADLGIHLALNSEWSGYRWGPVSSKNTVPTLLDRDGYLPLTEAEVVRQATLSDIERELRAQVDRAKSAGLRLSHLDSHMATLFRTREFFEVYRRVGQANGLPVLIERQGARGGTLAAWQLEPNPEALVDRVLSISPGVARADWRAAYEGLLAPLPPGVYQLIVHLAVADDEMRAATRGHDDWGAAWRQADFDLVRDPAFRRFLEQQGFVLVTWRALAAAQPR